MENEKSIFIDEFAIKIRKVKTRGLNEYWYVLTDLVMICGGKHHKGKGWNCSEFLPLIKKGKRRESEEKLYSNKTRKGGKQPHNVIDEMAVVEILIYKKRTYMLNDETIKKYNLKR